MFIKSFTLVIRLPEIYFYSSSTPTGKANLGKGKE
jgi:hypothetical protein